MFFKEEITLQELGRCCEIAYYDTIKGGYLSLSSLLVYPLLKKLYQINVVPSDSGDNWPCSLSEIDSVYEILSGKRNAVFVVTVGISASISSVHINEYDKKKEQYCQLKAVLLNYLATGVIECDGALMLETITSSEIMCRDSILDYIENHILAYVASIGIEGQQLNLINPLGLYCTKRESVQDVIKKAVRCIECYIGNENAGLQISYIDGIPELNAFLFN